MPFLLTARSRRVLSSASASGLPRKPCAFSSCVSSPIAKYASCSRAHASQKATPRISTSARRRQGLWVNQLDLLRRLFIDHVGYGGSSRALGIRDDLLVVW